MLTPPETNRGAGSAGDPVSGDLEGRFGFSRAQELTPERRVLLERHDGAAESFPLSNGVQLGSRWVRVVLDRGPTGRYELARPSFDDP